MGKQMCPWGPRLSHRVQSSPVQQRTPRWDLGAVAGKALCLSSGVGTCLGSLSEGRLVQGNFLMLPRRLLHEVQPAPLVLGLPRSLLSSSTPEIRPCFLALPPEQRAGLWEAESLLMGTQELAAFLGSACTEGHEAKVTF